MRKLIALAMLIAGMGWAEGQAETAAGSVSALPQQGFLWCLAIGGGLAVAIGLIGAVIMVITLVYTRLISKTIEEMDEK